MKKNLLFFICFLCLKNISFSQGWVGDGGNEINTVNSSGALSPIKVGIGTNAPTTQFHTTGSVRFQGLGTNNTQTHVVVGDANGNLFYRDLSTIVSSNAWLINGNTLTGSEFIGSINNLNFNVRTNNVQRMVFGSNGNIAVNSTDLTPALFSVYNNNEDFHYYASGSSPSYVLSQKTFRESATGGSTSPYGTLGLATRNGAYGEYASPGDLVLVNYNQNAIIFATQARQTITDPANYTDEKMRITGTGFIGVHTHTPTAILDVALPLDHSGDVRFENLPSGSGNILVIDANGYIKVSSQTAISSLRTTKDVSDEVNILKAQIQELQMQIQDLKKVITAVSSPSIIKDNSNINSVNSYLGQNIPNPSTNTTQIPFSIAEPFTNAYLQITQLASGVILKDFPLSKGQSTVNVSTSNLSAGSYYYSLIVNGKLIATKQMIVGK